MPGCCSHVRQIAVEVVDTLHFYLSSLQISIALKASSLASSNHTLGNGRESVGQDRLSWSPAPPFKVMVSVFRISDPMPASRAGGNPFCPYISP